MDKRIYLLRHGQPDFCKKDSYCIGRRSDPPLSTEGVRQANLLATCFPSLNRIYCSPLVRARQTARIIGGEACALLEMPALTEMDVGAWEGLSFGEIRSRFTESYAARGRDWSAPAPGGEPLADAASRVRAAILQIAEEEADESVAVTHDGAIRGLLWQLQQLDPAIDPMPRVPYGSITVLRYDGGTLSVAAAGRLPGEVPSDAEIAQLWDRYGASGQAMAHCQAVCRECMAICSNLADVGYTLSREELRAAALLHDLCRRQGKGHEQAAAQILRQMGYLRIARMVQLHTDGSDGLLDEAQILFYADKLYQGAEKVEIETRFARSISRCTGEEARHMHALRLDRARNIAAEIEGMRRRGERQ